MTDNWLGRSSMEAQLMLAWMGIRNLHADVPEARVTLVMGPGPGGPPGPWHLGADRWRPGGQEPEVLVSSEDLSRGPCGALTVLLHDAAHGVAAARGIQDAGRAAGSHNSRYRDIALELGLDVARQPAAGWSVTTLPPAAVRRYQAYLIGIDRALSAWRPPRHAGGVIARCDCGWRIRIGEPVLRSDPITCEMCQGEFAAPPGPSPGQV